MPRRRSSSPKKTTEKPAGKSRSGTASRKRNAKKSAAGRLHLISEHTGNLANHIVTSVLSQFPDPNVEKIWHLFVDSSEKVVGVMGQIRAKSDLVLHAMVSPALKKSIEDHCSQSDIGCLDLTGPISNFLSEHLQLKPRDDPSELHKIDSSYFKRIDAMEFTLQHDDSRRLDSIDQADIVLLGISRVSKSPTSTFLGSLGFRTANVSIVPSLGIPDEVKRCKGRVLALTMQPRTLYEIRRRRFELNEFAPKLAERNVNLDYLKPRDVAREVMEAEALYRKHRIPLVDVTGKTIEESAAHVLRTLNLVPHS